MMTAPHEPPKSREIVTWNSKRDHRYKTYKDAPFVSYFAIFSHQANNNTRGGNILHEPLTQHEHDIIIAS